jgi:hypothetical protein
MARQDVRNWRRRRGGDRGDADRSDGQRAGRHWRYRLIHGDVRVIPGGRSGRCQRAVMTGFPFLVRSTDRSGQVRYRLGDQLVDRYSTRLDRAATPPATGGSSTRPTSRLPATERTCIARSTSMAKISTFYCRSTLTAPRRGRSSPSQPSLTASDARRHDTPRPDTQPVRSTQQSPLE